MAALLDESSPPSHLLLPDLPLDALQLLLSSLSECQPSKDKLQSLIPTLTTLGAFLSSPPAPAFETAPEAAAATSPSISCFPLRSSQPYFKDIPDLPDIQSTELFDPEYLEDVEIEEEENLSLTIIHSSGGQQQRSGEGSTAAVKRKQRRKGVPRPRRVRRGSSEGEKEGKKLEAVENELHCDACDHTAATEEELKAHTRCFLIFMFV